VGKTVVEFDGESRRQVTRAIYIYRGLGTLSRLSGGPNYTTHFQEITTHFQDITTHFPKIIACRENRVARK
jgi:hypothetical protein